MKPLGSRGFTLLETMLAIALFAVVSVASYNIFTMGIQMWKRAREFSGGERQLILALERMGEDVGGMLRLEKETEFKMETEKKFEFGGDSAEFLIPAVVQTQNKDGGIFFQTGAIGYSWNESKKTICRSVQSESDLYLRKEPSCSVVAEGIENFRVSYWILSSLGSSYSWDDTWRGKEGVPQAIRLTFRLVPEGRKGLSPRNFQKTFMVPVADQAITDGTAASAGAAA